MHDRWMEEQVKKINMDENAKVISCDLDVKNGASPDRLCHSIRGLNPEKCQIEVGSMFWSKASSENGGSGTVYDYLEFYIDDEPQELVIGGDTDWNEYTVDLPLGEHLLRWVYEKDEAQSSGEDCAWLDMIQFPAGAVPPLSIDFGDLNFDSIVNILDVIVTVNYVVGHIELNNEQVQNADMNLDGTIDVFDILMIVDHALSN